MADLNTIISGEDSGFQAALARVESRITSFSGKTQQISRLSRGLVGGFGVAATAMGFVRLYESIKQVGDEAEKATDSFRGLAQAALDAGNARLATARGTQTPLAEERKRAAAEVKRIEEAANAEIVRLSGMSLWDQMKFEMANGYSEYVGEAIERLGKERDSKVSAINANSRIVQEELKKNAAAEQQAALSTRTADTTKEWEQYDQGMSRDRERALETVRRSQGTLATLMGDDGLSERLDREAMQRDLRENEYLSQDQRNRIGSLFADVQRLQREADDEGRRAAFTRGAGTLSLASGTGAAFGQQIAAINLPLADQTKKQTALQTKIAASLDEVARALGGGALVPTWQ